MYYTRRMANQRSKSKELITAWVHRDLKKDTKEIVKAEGCETVSDLVIKLLEERIALHQTQKVQPVADLVKKMLKGYESPYPKARQTA